MPGPSRRSWTWLAVGGLVLLNVALITALVLRQTTLDPSTLTAVPSGSSASSPDQPTTPNPTSTPTPSNTPTSESSSDPSPAPSGESPKTPTKTDVEVRDSGRVMAVSSGDVAWRAETTSCGKSSTVEVSTDGGRTWRATEPGLSAIVRLKSYGERSVFAVGTTGKSCPMSYAWIPAPNARWQTDASMTDNLWYRVPGEHVVHAPGGDTSRPCGDNLIGLAGLGTYEAAAICGDGRLRTTREGQGWTTVREDSGAVAIDADDNRFTVARAMDACDGLVVQHFVASGRGLSDKSEDCWDVDWRRSDPVAVASRGEATWLWFGAKVRRG